MVFLKQYGIFMKSYAFESLDMSRLKESQAALILLKSQERLSTLLPDTSQKMTLKDSQGNDMPWSAISMAEQDFSISMPNESGFMKLIEKIEDKYDLKIPEATWDKTQQERKLEYKSLFEKVIKSEDTFEKSELDFVKEADEPSLILIADSLRDIANELHEKQEMLMKRKTELKQQYLASGSEDTFRQMISLNDQLVELTHQQDNLSSAFEVVQEASQEFDSPDLQANLNLTKTSVERNTLSSQPEKDVLVNTNALREEYSSKDKNKEKALSNDDDNSFTF